MGAVLDSKLTANHVLIIVEGGNSAITVIPIIPQNHTMLHQDKECPICNQGMIGFRLCDDHSTLVMMCDECEALWNVGANIDPETALYPQSSNYTVPGTELSIASPRSRWATLEEVKCSGIELSSVHEGKAIDEI